MGVFDGVHVGHRTLLAQTTAIAAPSGLASVVLVFDPHPDEVIGRAGVVPRLTSVERTAELISQEGVDHVVVLAFDSGVSALSPEAFIDGLAPGIELRALVMTPDSRFGHRRAGTPERAAEIGADRGFRVQMAELVEADGVVVSSSRIRSAVAQGDLATAARLLGRPHALEGRVTRPASPAAGEGSASPVPLECAYHPALPGPGRYQGRLHDAADGIGAPIVTLDVGAAEAVDTASAANVAIIGPPAEVIGRSVRVELVGAKRPQAVEGRF